MEALIEPIMKAVMKVIEWTLAIVVLLTVGAAQFVVRKVRSASGCSGRVSPDGFATMLPTAEF